MNKLALMRQRIANTPGLGRDLLVLFALLATGLVVSAYLVVRTSGTEPFTDKQRFSAVFDMAPAVQLAVQQEVRIAGVPVGQIVDAEPTPEGHARLTFQIDAEHDIYDNARLTFRSKTPLNIMYVALEPGGPPGALLADDADIPVSQTDRVLQPYELLNELDDRTQVALSALVNEADVALANAPTDLPDALAAIDSTMESLDPIVVQLHERREHLEQLVTSVSVIVDTVGSDDERLVMLIDSLETTLATIEQRDTELGQTLDALPGVTDTLRTSMRSTEELTGQLTPVLQEVGEASEVLPGSLESLRDTVRTAEGVVRQARPVVQDAKPVVDDLAPLTDDLASSVRDLRPVAANLPQLTEDVVPWLDHLGAFVYQTSSAFGLGDANGGLGRAQLNIVVTDPLGSRGDFETHFDGEED